MITMLFMFGLLYVFGQILFLGIKAAWGLTKILFIVLFWPLILIVMVLCGLMYIAFPILAIIGLISLIKRKSI